jgi:hypothetical protein
VAKYACKTLSDELIFLTKYSSRGEKEITRCFGHRIPGSSPGGSTTKKKWYNEEIKICGYSLVVEHLVANQKTGFRLPLPAHFDEFIINISVFYKTA